MIFSFIRLWKRAWRWCELSLRSAFTVALVLQIVDFPVVHVFERIMKGIVGVAEVVPQECLQRTVEEMGDVPESQMSNAGDSRSFTNAGHGMGGVAVCPSRQLASQAVPVLTMTKVSICKVFEIVLGWRGGELDISPLYAGCHAADVGWTARRPLCAWSKSSTFRFGQS